MTAIKSWWSRQDSMIWMSYFTQAFMVIVFVFVCVVIYGNIHQGHYTAAVFNFFVNVLNVYTFLSAYYTRRSHRRNRVFINLTVEFADLRR